MPEKEHNQLLSGPILQSVVKLALPITATAFVQMTYNLVDMFWISKIGTAAVAAVGAGGMFLWFSEGLLMLSRMGGQVFTAQRIGAGDKEGARAYATASLELSFMLALLFCACMFIFHRPLIGLYNFQNAELVQMAHHYLLIVSVGVIFSFVGNTLTALSIASGNSRLPFAVNVAGLMLNMILDPVFIFVLNLGVAGAALATMLSQVFVCTLMSSQVLRMTIFRHLPFKRQNRLLEYRSLLRFGLAPAGQSMGFTTIGIVLSRIVSNFGEAAFAIQRIGVQIEAISWMTGDGFGNALRAFVSQNYGANKLKRALQGQRLTQHLMFGLGLINGILLYVLAEPIYRAFSNDPQVLAGGANYLRILALSQAAMCVEIILEAAFNGFGQSTLPAMTALFFTAIRIPMAWILVMPLGVDGVWWAITLSSLFKGIILWILFRIFYRKKLLPQLKLIQ